MIWYCAYSVLLPKAVCWPGLSVYLRVLVGTHLCWVCCCDFLYLVRLLCEVRMASLCASTGCSTTCLPCVIGCICGAHLLGIVHSCCVLGVVVGSGLYIYCVPCYVLLAV